MDFGLESMPIAYAWGGEIESDLLGSFEDLWNVGNVVGSEEGLKETLIKIKDFFVTLFNKIIALIRTIAKKLLNFIIGKKSTIQHIKSEYSVTDDVRFDQPKEFKILSKEIDKAISDNTFNMSILSQYSKEHHINGFTSGYKEKVKYNTGRVGEFEASGHHEFDENDESYESRFVTLDNLSKVSPELISIRTLTEAEQIIAILKARVTKNTDQWNFFIRHAVNSKSGDVRIWSELKEKEVNEDRKRGYDRYIENYSKQFKICQKAASELSKIISWWSNEIAKSILEIEQFVCDYIKNNPYKVKQDSNKTISVKA